MGEPNADLRRARALAQEKEQKDNQEARTLTRAEMSKFGPVGPESGVDMHDTSSEDDISKDHHLEEGDMHTEEPGKQSETPVSDEESKELKLVKPKEKNPIADHPAVKNLQKILGRVRKEQMIPTGEIIKSEQNPRTDFDPEELEELGSSLEGGQLIAVLVRPLTSTEQAQHSGKKYMLIAGERRWRGAQAKEIPEIRCIVAENDVDPEMSFLMSVLENVGRKDISFHDEARVCIKLRDAYKMSVPQIAKFCSFRSDMPVKKRLAIEDVPQNVVDLLDAERVIKLFGGRIQRELPSEAIYQLAPYKHDPQFQYTMAYEILDTEIPVDQCKAYIQRRAKAMGKESQRKERARGGPSAIRSFLSRLTKRSQGTVDTLSSRYSSAQMRDAFPTRRECEEMADKLEKLSSDLWSIATQLRPDNK